MRKLVRKTLALLLILSIFIQPESALARGQWLDNQIEKVNQRWALIMNHEHQWQHGKCAICMQLCNHPSHSIDGTCSVCGKKTYHKYDFGVCRCGKVLEFRENMLPDEYYFEDCEEQGELHAFELYGQLSDVSDTIAGKKFEVYTPYNYDPNRPYDVMFLQGGLGNHYNACTSQMWFLAEDVPEGGQREDTRQFCFRTIWDHMICDGVCEPMIIVSVDGYSDKHGNPRTRDYYEETAYFVRNYIYPFIVDNFSTYALSSSPEDIIRARDHFGYGGFSNGGWMTYWGAMNGMLDICANFLPMGGSWRAEEVAETVHKYSDIYPIASLFAGAGINDGYSLDQLLDDYLAIVTSSGSLMNGYNAWYFASDYGHDWNAGSILLYDGLQVMFPYSE